MKTQEDCFFYLESSDSDEEKHIRARCLNCQKDDDGGWFWNGSEKGYSKYNINCSVCGKSIYIYEENTEERNKEKSE